MIFWKGMWKERLGFREVLKKLEELDLLEEGGIGF